MIKPTLTLLTIAILFIMGCQTPAPPPPIKLVSKMMPAVEKPQVISRTVDLIPFTGTPATMVINLFERLKLIFPTITLQVDNPD
jgi:hypothetical protein